MKRGLIIGHIGEAAPDNSSTQSNLIGGISTIGYATASNEYTANISPKQNPQRVPPRPDAETIDQRRNILSNRENLNTVQSTIFKRQEVVFPGYSARAGLSKTRQAARVGTASSFSSA